MSIHTTNYYDTFIEVAEDCPVASAEIPPLKGNEKTTARLQFELLENHPYELTSDEVLFQVYAIKNNISKDQLERERVAFFSKGQPCMRCSPLSKRYGWGVHSNKEGKIALVPLGEEEYERLKQASELNHVKAMRSKRA